MPRIVALDYGTKRTGIAVTDPLQMIATALTTVHSKDLLKFLSDYFEKEVVESICVGQPLQRDGTASESEVHILKFIKQFRQKFPQIEIHRVDERFTSKIAMQSLISSGVKKSERQNKALIDSTSAVIILQSFLERRK